MSTTTRRSPLSWFRDLGVSVKISAALAVASLVAVAVGVLGLTALSETATATQQMHDSAVLGVDETSEAAKSILRMQVAATEQALAQTAEEKAAAEATALAEEAAAREALATYRGIGHPDAQLAEIDALLTELDQYAAARDSELFPAGRAGDVARWDTARDELTPVIAAMMSGLAAMDEAEIAEAAGDAEAAMAGYQANRMQVLLLLGIGLALAITLGLLVARAIVAGLRRVQHVADALERADLTVTADLASTDEVGRMGTALDAAVLSLRDVVATIDSSATALAGAAEEMSATTAQIAAGAEETSAQAGAVSAAAEQISRNVQSVASGTEQMGGSIREIAHNATEAARAAASAVEAARASSQTVGRLGESSKEIGDVVKAITQIAEQTNLLALNATIEAARAGEAGKGFAVVANEVKELAQETAKATEDIARRVETIQADSTQAVSAISEISQIIDQVNGFQETIASAVEEQTATTNEMGRSVTEAATGSGEIAANIAGVAMAADQTTQGVGQSQTAVGELTRMATDLRGMVGRFTV